MTSITSWFQLPPEIRRTIIFHIFNANHPKNSGDATVRPTFDLLQVGEVAALLSQISHAVGRELLSNGCTGASSVFLKRMKSVKSELKDITDAMLASHVANGSPEVVPNQHWEVVNICLDYIQHHAVKALLVWETCQAIQKMAVCPA